MILLAALQRKLCNIVAQHSLQHFNVNNSVCYKKRRPGFAPAMLHRNPLPWPSASPFLPRF
jgi:hypothetical protein